jgi:hypothetical protein
MHGNPKSSLTVALHSFAKPAGRLRKLPYLGEGHLGGERPRRVALASIFISLSRSVASGCCMSEPGPS